MLIVEIWIIFLALLIFFELLADIAAKEYSLSGKLSMALLAIFFYIAANTSWIVSLRSKSALAIGANIFSVTTGITALIIGVFIYGEIVSTKQYIGIALGTISLFLLIF